MSELHAVRSRAGDCVILRWWPLCSMDDVAPCHLADPGGTLGHAGHAQEAQQQRVGLHGCCPRQATSSTVRPRRPPVARSSCSLSLSLVRIEMVGSRRSKAGGQKPSSDAWALRQLLQSRPAVPALLVTRASAGRASRLATTPRVRAALSFAVCWPQARNWTLETRVFRVGRDLCDPLARCP